MQFTKSYFICNFWKSRYPIKIGPMSEKIANKAINVQELLERIAELCFNNKQPKSWWINTGSLFFPHQNFTVDPRDAI